MKAQRLKELADNCHHTLMDDSEDYEIATALREYSDLLVLLEDEPQLMEGELSYLEGLALDCHEAGLPASCGAIRELKRLREALTKRVAK
jgi:hypothetical protein